jgi:hypothetical protein
MFITVSVGGIIAVAATAAATGAITGLYIRAKMVKAAGTMRESIASMRERYRADLPRPRKSRSWRAQKKV